MAQTNGGIPEAASRVDRKLKKLAARQPSGVALGGEVAGTSEETAALFDPPAKPLIPNADGEPDRG